MRDTFEVFVVSSRAADYIESTEESHTSKQTCLQKWRQKFACISGKLGRPGICLIAVLLGIVAAGAIIAAVFITLVAVGRKSLEHSTFENDSSSQLSKSSSGILWNTKSGILNVTQRLENYANNSSNITWGIKEQFNSIDYLYETDSYGNETLITASSNGFSIGTEEDTSSFCDGLWEYQCLDGRCIERSKKCDGRRDCSRAEDEKSCNCINFLNASKICDSYNDCLNSEDEIGCSYNCKDKEFKCFENGGCIPVSKICNGLDDCSLGEDEKNCWALSEEMLGSLQEIQGRKFYLENGYLQAIKNGEIFSVCSDGWSESFSRSICTNLGYRILHNSSQVSLPKNFSSVHLLRVVTSKELVGDVNSGNIWQKLAENSKCDTGAVVQVSCSELECGKAPSCAPRRRRIVGGQSAGGGCHPWAVALYRDGQLTCQAVVLNKRWLLTAAHCFKGSTRRHWVARLGFYRQLSRNPEEQVRIIDGVVWHPNYTDSPLDTHDVALIRMKDSVRFGPSLRPPCLPKNEGDFPKNGDRCTVIGWGYRTEKGDVLVDSLQSVRLPLMDPSLCNETKAFEGNIHGGHLCLYHEAGNMDACQGDSGGALLCDREDGSEYLGGITSTGFGCGRPDIPGIWTKLAMYITWINDANEKVGNSNGTVTTVGGRFPCLGFQCRLGDCIYPWLQCDGQKDCLTDGSDEENC